MLFTDLLAEVLGDLRKRWLRTGLTMTGIIAGTLLIVAMVSIGEGMRDFMETQWRSLSNPKLLFVFPQRVDFRSVLMDTLGQIGSPPREITEDREEEFQAIRRLMMEGPRYLKEEEIQKVRDVDGITAVWPGVILNARWITLEGDPRKFTVHAAPWGWPHRDAIPLESGRLFSSNDADEVILSPYYVESFGLESGKDLIGRRVVIPLDRTFMPVLGELNPFPRDEADAVEYQAEVVGLMKRTLFSTAALIPHGTSIRLAREVQKDPTLHTAEKYGVVAVALVDREENAQAVVKAIKKKDLGARSEMERYQILNSVFLFINIALSLVGGAALGVAALGIANTLLMSVFERTREIGLYMALGATRRTIRWLFAVEAATIGLLGGILGVGAAVGLGTLANLVFHMIMQDRWQGYALFHFPPWLLLGTVAFAVLIASLAGFYPSHRASRLDPIAALRYD